METPEQEREAFPLTGKDVTEEPGLHSELILLNAVFEAARMGRAGETFALRITEMARRLISLGS